MPLRRPRNHIGWFGHTQFDASDEDGLMRWDDLGMFS